MLGTQYRRTSSNVMLMTNDMTISVNLSMAFTPVGITQSQAADAPRGRPQPRAMNHARSGKTTVSKSGLSLTQITKHKPDPLPRYGQISVSRVESRTFELGPLVQMGSVLIVRRSCFNWRSSK
jgi:hypothetical protein